jgi:hypothetical protein
MSVEPEQLGPPPKEGIYFRAAIGLIALLGGLLGLVALYFVEVPEGNKEPLLLALGIVLQWGGSVVASEYGATTTGRRVADAAVKKIEQETATTAADANAARNGRGGE